MRWPCTDPDADVVLPRIKLILLIRLIFSFDDFKRLAKTEADIILAFIYVNLFLIW